MNLLKGSIVSLTKEQHSKIIDFCTTLENLNYLLGELEVHEDTAYTVEHTSNKLELVQAQFWDYLNSLLNEEERV